MDELEISGKRYISTRRAAKEHKYHSDYIGQLIRAKKVEGQKVGRSWYVSEDSLNAYFSNEASAPVARVVEVPQVVVAPAVKVAEPIPALGVVEEKIVEKVIETIPEEIEIKKDEHQIPVKIAGPAESYMRQSPLVTKIAPVRARTSLRYVADDEPLYPPVAREVYVEAEIPEEIIEETPVHLIERSRAVKTKRNFILSGSAVVVAGVLTVGLVAAASVFITSTTTVKGQAASVGYTLQPLK